MATTKILLREDIDNLGGRGEIVKVKAGYARNLFAAARYCDFGNERQCQTN